MRKHKKPKGYDHHPLCPPTRFGRGQRFIFFLNPAYTATLNLSTDADSILLVGPIQFRRSCKIVFCGEAVWLFLIFPEAAPTPTSPPSPSSPLNKHWIFHRGQTGWGRVNRMVVIALMFFFLLHAPNLFVYIKKVPKHNLFTLAKFGSSHIKLNMQHRN